MKRNRLLYLVFLFLVVISGLASRYYANLLPSWVHLYAGDALWALMVYILVAVIFNHKPILWVTVVAVSFSFGIEISQLYHAVWIDSLRSTKIGGLVLGFGFLWSDLVCYMIGIGFGCLIEILLLKFRLKN